MYSRFFSLNPMFKMKLFSGFRCSSCRATRSGPEDFLVGGSEGPGLSAGRPAAGWGAGGVAAWPLLRLCPDVLQAHPLPGGERRGGGGSGETPAAVRLQKGELLFFNLAAVPLLFTHQLLLKGPTIMQNSLFHGSVLPFWSSTHFITSSCSSIAPGKGKYFLISCSTQYVLMHLLPGVENRAAWLQFISTCKVSAMLPKKHCSSL